MTKPLYSVLTWDTFKQAYTIQRGLQHQSININKGQLRDTLKRLKKEWGYSCHRRRSPEGDHDDNDIAILVERTDGKSIFEILRGAKR